MASGKKNYFRHSFNAFEDEKIQMAIDKLGYEGYAYYFILIELLAKQCEAEYKNPIRIHQQSLRIVWRKQSQSCKKVITKLQESGLFVATFKESFIEFDIPNLSKYLGKYSIKNPPNTPNKKKRKEKKRKESILPPFEVIIDHLNAVLRTSFRHTTAKTKNLIQARFNEGFTEKDFRLVVEKKNKDWCGDAKMHKYLRPETLFGNKFESYLQEAITENQSELDLAKSLGGEM